MSTGNRTTRPVWRRDGDNGWSAKLDGADLYISIFSGTYFGYVGNVRVEDRRMNGTNTPLDALKLAVERAARAANPAT